MSLNLSSAAVVIGALRVKFRCKGGPSPVILYIIHNNFQHTLTEFIILYFPKILSFNVLMNGQFSHALGIHLTSTLPFPRIEVYCCDLMLL